MSNDVKYKNGEPCSHPGCLSHTSHPCEGCGRVAGKGVVRDADCFIGISNRYRGLGTTTRQMRDAPEGSVYVWPNSNLLYPRHLAKQLGREDLKIIGPSFLQIRNWIGRKLTGVVIDHATILSAKERDLLVQIHYYIVKSKESF